METRMVAVGEPPALVGGFVSFGVPATATAVIASVPRMDEIIENTFMAL